MELTSNKWSGSMPIKAGPYLWRRGEEREWQVVEVLTIGSQAVFYRIGDTHSYQIAEHDEFCRLVPVNWWVKFYTKPTTVKAS